MPATLNDHGIVLDLGLAQILRKALIRLAAHLTPGKIDDRSTIVNLARDDRAGREGPTAAAAHRTTHKSGAYEDKERTVSTAGGQHNMFLIDTGGPID